MHIERRMRDGSALFVVTDISDEEREGGHALGWVDVEGGVAAVVPAGSDYLETAYANFERYAPRLIDRMLGRFTFPWQDALEATLHLIGDTPFPWFLTGSIAMAVRGIAVAPGDIDMVTTAEGARHLQDLFAPYLIQPLTYSPNWTAAWFCRAYLHGQVEWVGEVRPNADQPQPSDFGPVAASRLEEVEWRGYSVKVPPLDLQLAVNRRRGREDRAQAIENWLQSRPTPP